MGIPYEIRRMIFQHVMALGMEELQKEAPKRYRPVPDDQKAPRSALRMKTVPSVDLLLVNRSIHAELSCQKPLYTSRSLGRQALRSQQLRYAQLCKDDWSDTRRLLNLGLQNTTPTSSDNIHWPRCSDYHLYVVRKALQISPELHICVGFRLLYGRQKRLDRPVKINGTEGWFKDDLQQHGLQLQSVYVSEVSFDHRRFLSLRSRCHGIFVVLGLDDDFLKGYRADTYYLIKRLRREHGIKHPELVHKCPGEKVGSRRTKLGAWVASLVVGYKVIVY
jgi:hypothetical protein